MVLSLPIAGSTAQFVRTLESNWSTKLVQLIEVLNQVGRPGALHLIRGATIRRKAPDVAPLIRCSAPRKNKNVQKGTLGPTGGMIWGAICTPKALHLKCSASGDDALRVPSPC